MFVANEFPRRLRLEAKLSLHQLAELSGVDARIIHRLETGREVTELIVNKIANGLSKALGREITEKSLLISPPNFYHDINIYNTETNKRKYVDDIGEFIRRSLSERGMSREVLAHALGVSTITVSRWIRGATVPNPQKIALLSKFFGIDVAESLTLRFPQVPETPEARRGTKNRTAVLEKTAEAIPNQSPLIQFRVSDNGKLRLVPSLIDENDYETIEALRSEMLAAGGPIDRLKERYAQNPNVPQAGLFGPLTTKYDGELSKDARKINYTVLYARGARFYAARRAAAQQVASGEWPELDAEETEAIDAICDLHGPLIMASAAGRKIIEDAHQYEVPPNVFERDQETIEEFGQTIAAETEIVEPEASEAYRELTAKVDGDPQPARSRGLGIAATGSALTAIVGGAAWYGAGGAVATFIVPAAAVGAAGLVGGFFWEAVKAMPRFKQATSKVGEQFERALDQAEKVADPNERVLLERMAHLVERKRPLFEKVANLRPEFGWVKNYLKSLQNSDELLMTMKDNDFEENTDDKWSYFVGIDNLPGRVSIQASSATQGSDIFHVHGRRTVNGPSFCGEDDDRLFYSIVDGGKGFLINPINGKVTLSSPAPTGGRFLLTIRVSDEHSPPNKAEETLEVFIEE